MYKGLFTGRAIFYFFMETHRSEATKNNVFNTSLELTNYKCLTQGRLVAKINGGAASENSSHCFNKQ